MVDKMMRVSPTLLRPSENRLMLTMKVAQHGLWVFFSVILSMYFA
jgi:hypothetical protein